MAINLNRIISNNGLFTFSELAGDCDMLIGESWLGLCFFLHSCVVVGKLVS
jgi:hypothetical protein